MKLKGVILTAGKGKRLQPLTYNRPKPLLPVAGRTILQHNIDKMLEAGIDDITIVVSGGTTQQISKLMKAYYPDAKLNYVEQLQPLGTAHAVDIVKQNVGDSDFLMVYGDNVTTYNYSKLISEHSSKSAVTMALMHADDPRKHGVVEVSEDKIVGIVEKPENPKSDLAFAGMCVLTPSIFEAISQTKKSSRGEYYLTDSIQLLIDWGYQAKYAILDTWRLNVNNHQDLLKANKLLLSEVSYLPAAQAGQNNYNINFKIVPPVVFIGENTSIENSATIGPYVTVGESVHVGEQTQIQNSVILSGAKIGRNCVIANSILGKGATVKDGFQTSNEPVALVLGDGESA